MGASKVLWMENQLIRQEQLQDWIENHDCHLNPQDLDSSCVCTDWREELEGNDPPEYLVDDNPGN